MDLVFPWAMVGVSLAMFYIERVMREMEASAARGKVPENFPLERLVALRERLESRRPVIWSFLVVGSVWGLQNILV